MRSLVLSLGLATLLILPGCSASRSLPTGVAPGDRVRITRAEGAVVGSLMSSSDDRLVVQSEGDTISISRALIASVERQDGTRGRAGRGAGYGALAGGVAGGLIMLTCDNEGGLFTCADIAPFVVGSGTVVGLLFGALVGSAFRRENWTVVPLVDLSALGGTATAPTVSYVARLSFR